MVEMPNGAGKETMSFTNNYFYVKDVKKIQGHAINRESFNNIKIFLTQRVCYTREIKGLVSGLL